MYVYMYVHCTTLHFGTNISRDVGLEISMDPNPNKVLVNKVVEPLPLPMDQFNLIWGGMSSALQSLHMRIACFDAHKKLYDHSVSSGGPAILGCPDPDLVVDYKFAPNLVEHVVCGEFLAQAALQIEMLICNVSGLKHKLYFGRSQ